MESNAKIAAMVFIALMAFGVGCSYAQSTACTSATNISNQAVLRFDLGNIIYNFTENYITPDYAGITINGYSYSPVYPNTTTVISPDTGAYTEITQINYFPIQKSIDMILCSEPQASSTYYIFNVSDNNYGNLYFSYLGARLIVSSGSNSSAPVNATVINATGETPGAPDGYVKLTALHVEVSTSVQTQVNMVQAVPCSLSSGSVSAYTLQNNEWTQPQALQPSTGSICSVELGVPDESTIGIFYYSPGATTTSISTSSTTSTAATTISTTSTSAPTTTTVPTTTVNPNQCTEDIQCPVLIGECSNTACLVNKCIDDMCQMVSVPLKPGSNSTPNFGNAGIPVGAYLSYIESSGGWITPAAAVLAVIIPVLLVRHLLNRKAKKKEGNK